MRYRKTSLIVPFAALLLQAANPSIVFAQQAATEARLEWPKTFNGQPDFDFTRQEIITELKEQQGENETLPIATMNKLITEIITDPFSSRRNVPGWVQSDGKEDGSSEELSTDQEAINTLFGPDELPEVTGLPEYNVINRQLPGFNEQNYFDLSEFQRFLDNVISQEVKFNKADLRDRNFIRDLQRVTIQSIVTSPQKYAIINKVRYRVGDRFLLPVRATIEDSNLEKMIDAYLPHPDTVSDDVYRKYVRLKKEALTRAQQKNKEVNANAKVHNVSVTIRDILHRKVKVSIFGREYDIKMKLTL